ncbi:HAD hydrolase family protein [Halospina sp. K52047b]|uniref:KdsC family phosphatase n=1 Tax=Halospina sp. K52047b TaxID=2614160 RepID=UPI00124A5506|nr:HAD hydrolase family protein [Halospina sp. K52047b]KAA8979780.1 HAD hydrolase family protein [Halospina sp. K52047b]
MTAPLNERGATIQLLAMDVDGVLTDGSLYFAASGDELKAFSILDGQGLRLIQTQGLITAFITGRTSPLTEARARNLDIGYLIQGRTDKLTALRELSERTSIPLNAIAYVGDDLPDLAAIEAAGIGISVPNGCAAVRGSADWCTTAPGGSGAIREVCEWLLACRGVLDQLVDGYRAP